MKRLTICLFTLGQLLCFDAFAVNQASSTTQDTTQYPVLAQKSSRKSHSPRTYVAPPPSDLDSNWAINHSNPWDVSGVIGIYNPGFGFQGLVAYRIVDDLIPNVDETLSIESGLGYMSVSDTIAGVSVSYSEIEIPIMARWDFHLRDAKLIVGPRAGFNYLTAGTATIGGVQYTSRGGALYVQLGGFGMYRINDQWAVRAQLMFLNYTALTFGGTFFF